MKLGHHMLLEVRSWNRNIRLFFMSNLLYQFGSGMFSVLYNLYIKDLGFSQEMNGSIVSMQSLATALLFIPIGFLGDRIHRKPILVVGAFMTGILFMGRAYAVDEPYLLLFAIGTGIFTSFYQVLAVPFLAEQAGKDKRLKLFSYHFSMVLAAQVLGSLGGGWFADSMQMMGLSSVSSLQISLFIGGAATMISFFPLLFVKEQKPVHEAIRPEHSVDLQPIPGNNGTED